MTAWQVLVEHVGLLRAAAVLFLVSLLVSLVVAWLIRGG